MIIYHISFLHVSLYIVRLTVLVFCVDDATNLLFVFLSYCATI